MRQAIRSASTMLHCSVSLYRELALSAATLLPRRRQPAAARVRRREPATA